MRPNVHVLVAAACAALLAGAGVARAAPVAVLPVEGSNLTPGELDAIGVLVANAFAAEAGIDVARPADTAQAVAEAGGLPGALAKLGAREYVETSAVQLGSRITVQTVLRDAAGTFLHSAELSAGSLDEVQPVAIRLTRALVRRTSVEGAPTPRQAARLERETRREAIRAEREARREAIRMDREARREWARQNRTYSEHVMGLKTAVIWPRVSGRQFSPSMALQFDGRVERTWGFLEFGAGTTLPSSNSQRDGLGSVFAEFGGSAYFVDASTSPYLGVGVVPRVYWTEDDGGVSASLYGQAGIMFLRDWSSRVYVEFRIAQSVIPFEAEEYDPATLSYRTAEYYPMELALQLGMGW